jgi:N-acetylglutamate synthase-like GNAT family acetyltransferase
MAPDSRAATVREAREGDLPRLLALLYQLSQQGERPETAVEPATVQHETALHELMADPRFQLLVVEDTGQVQGSCVLYVLPNLSYGATPFGVIENVIVDEQVRRRGYGELLIAAAVRRAKEAGCYKIALQSNARRAEAHRFYERIGFVNSHKGFTNYF